MSELRLGWIRNGRHVVAGTRRFTQTQFTIFKAYAEGKSLKEIAAERQCSPKTIEYHMHCVQRLTGYKNAAKLVQFALKHGIAGWVVALVVVLLCGCAAPPTYPVAHDAPPPSFGLDGGRSEAWALPPRMALAATGPMVTPPTTAARLTWSAVTGASWYQFYWGTNSGEPYPSSQRVTNATTLLAQGFALGTKYYFTGRAIGTNGAWGNYCPEVSWVAAPSTNPPMIVLTIQASTNMASWTDVGTTTNAATEPWQFFRLKVAK